MLAREILLEYVSPAVGMMIGNWMFTAPYHDLREAIGAGHLGDLNPTPWAFMLGNCLGWVAYGLLKRNFWIYFGNAPGFCLSVWLNMGAVKLQYKAYWATQWEIATLEYLKTHDNDNNNDNHGAGDETVTKEKNGRSNSLRKEMEEISPKRTISTANSATTVATTLTAAPAPHEGHVMLIVFVWLSCISVIGFSKSLSLETKQFVVGIVANLNVLFFYGAPLSTMYQVLRTQNSASIHIMTMIANTLNGTFWGIYGLAIFDPFVFAPNLLGAGLGAIQMVLVVIFPRKGRENSREENETDVKDAIVLDKPVVDDKGTDEDQDEERLPSVDDCAPEA